MSGFCRGGRGRPRVLLPLLSGALRRVARVAAKVGFVVGVVVLGLERGRGRP